MTGIQPRPSDHDHLKWLQEQNLGTFQGESLLDLGCGSGYLCERAVQDGAKKVVGIDVVPPSSLPVSGWLYKDYDLNDPQWADRALTSLDEKKSERFSRILAFDILEHLDAPPLFLRSCRTLLGPGGKLVITTPNSSSWERFVKPRGWSGCTDPQHKVLFHPYNLRFLLERCCFRIHYLRAPLRKLGPANRVVGLLGGQLLAVAEPCG